MAWEINIVEVVRILINDFGSIQKYDDDTLRRIILVAGFQVNNELDFTQDFIIDIAEQTILPDPCDKENHTDDDSFVNLTAIKSACILDRGSAITSATAALSGRDANGFVSFDLRGVAESKLQLLKLGWCAVYADEKEDYQLGSQKVAGAAIMSPFRTIARGLYTNSNYYNIWSNL